MFIKYRDIFTYACEAIMSSFNYWTTELSFFLRVKELIYNLIIQVILL